MKLTVLTMEKVWRVPVPLAELVPKKLNFNRLFLVCADGSRGHDGTRYWLPCVVCGVPFDASRRGRSRALLVLSFSLCR